MASLFSFACASGNNKNKQWGKWKIGKEELFVCASTSNAIVQALKYFFCHFVCALRKKNFYFMLMTFLWRTHSELQMEIAKKYFIIFSFAYRSPFLNFLHIFTLSLRSHEFNII
jgi:hypothetical protein